MDNPSVCKRIRRVLHLRDLVCAGVLLRPNELAHSLGVSRRTLFRDLSVLRSLGLVVRTTRRQPTAGGPVTSPPVNVSFTLEEATALLTLLAIRARPPVRSAERQALAISLSKLLAAMQSPRVRSVLAAAARSSATRRRVRRRDLFKLDRRERRTVVATGSRR